MKSPPSLPKLSPPTLRYNVSARWKYKDAIVHGNIEDCTWEYKLGIKFIRNEGEGTLSRCNIGQEIARGKAFFQIPHSSSVLSNNVNNHLVEITLSCQRRQSHSTWKVKNFDNSKLSDLARISCQFRFFSIQIPDLRFHPLLQWKETMRCSFVLRTDHH